MVNSVPNQLNSQINKDEIVSIDLKWHQKFYYFFKCFFDTIISFILLLLLLPLFLVVGIAIKIDSKGPVFFVYNRVGKNGKEFKCFKFRSMSTLAKPDSASCDFVETAQITKVGKFLRKTSIDELPQLINVLFGKMNLIGYRPVISKEYELNNLRKKYGVFQLRPGITGWAQVNGRDLLGADPRKKAQFDEYYVKHVSLWLDVKIFFKTIKVVLSSQDNIDGELKNKL